MEERDRPGVTIVATVVASALGALTDSPALAGGAAGLAPALEYLIARHAAKPGHIERLLTDSLEISGVPPTALREWLEGDERRLRLTTEALEAAWATYDLDKVRLLSHVLADGMVDDARLDIDRLVTHALRDLDPPHLAVLAWFADNPKSDVDQAVQRHPLLSGGFHAIFAALLRHGCLTEVAADMGGFGSYTRPSFYHVTDFGETCLDYVRRAVIN